MTSYATLQTQINALTADMTTTLAGGVSSASDYAYYANALVTLGSVLGVNDIVAATSNQVSTITTTGTTQVGLVNTAGTTQVSAVNSAGATQVAAVSSTASNIQTYAYMGVLA